MTFLLFAGSEYYPCGGWEDFKGAFQTQEAAAATAKALKRDWWQVVNAETRVIVERGEG